MDFRGISDTLTAAKTAQKQPWKTQENEFFDTEIGHKWSKWPCPKGENFSKKPLYGGNHNFLKLILNQSLGLFKFKNQAQTIWIQVPKSSENCLTFCPKNTPHLHLTPPTPVHKKSHGSQGGKCQILNQGEESHSEQRDPHGEF